MFEQSAENALSKDEIKIEQPRDQNSNRLSQNTVTNDISPKINQLSKQISEFDKKNARIEELILSIKKDIKNAVSTLETNHQIITESSTIIKEFHEEIARLQMQFQKIQLVITDVYKSKITKNTKKDGKDKKQKKMKNELQDKEKKKNKKKIMKMKMKQK